MKKMDSRRTQEEQTMAAGDCGGHAAESALHCNGCRASHAGLEAQELALRLDRLEEKVSKWGRMLKALLAVFARKGITSKDEVMAEVYARIGASGDSGHQGSGEIPDDWERRREPELHASRAVRGVNVEVHPNHNGVER